MNDFPRGSEQDKTGDLLERRDFLAELQWLRDDSRTSAERIERLVSCIDTLGTDARENIKRLTALPGEVFGASLVVYFRTEAGGLRPCAEWNVPDDFDYPDKADGLPYLQASDEHSERVTVINDLIIQAESWSDPNPARYRLDTYMGCPIRQSGAVTGFLGMFFRERVIPTRVDKAITRLIALYIGMEEIHFEAAELLRRSELLHRSVVESSPIPLLKLDKEGRVEYTNTTFSSLWGSPDLARKGVVGSSFFDLHLDWEQDNLMMQIRRLLQGEILESVESSYVPAENSPQVVVSLAGVPCFSPYGVVTGAVVALLDVTERKQAELDLRQAYQDLEKRIHERTAELARANAVLELEIRDREKTNEALKKSESRYRGLVESSPIGIIYCDIQGDITEINPQALRILGLASSDSLRAVNMTSSPQLVEAGIAGSVRSCLQSNEATVAEFAYKTPAGRKGYVRVHLAPVPGPEGRPEGVQVLLEDVSEFKKTHDQLVKAERVKAVGRMSGGVALAFNNLLQFVATTTQAALASLQSGNLSFVRPLLVDLLDSTRHAAGTIRRLQQDHRVRTDTAILRWRPFDLNEAVREGLRMSKLPSDAASRESSGRVRLELNLGRGCMVEGDETEIAELVVNLLNNAAEAMPDGGTITVRSTAEGDHVLLQVKDDGPGIPQENLDTIFEPFWTSKDSHAGLGLALNAGIARRHGGRIFVKTRKGQGTVMTVKLPLARRPRSEELADATVPIRELGLIVLLAAQDRDQLNAWAKTFEELGHELVPASSGKETLEVFEASDVDAVVCDLNMPDMDGWEINKSFQKICVAKGMPKPPFIMLTDKAGELDNKLIYSHPGVNRIVEKPIEPARLLEIIRQEILDGTIIGQNVILRTEDRSGRQ